MTKLEEFKAAPKDAFICEVNVKMFGICTINKHGSTSLVMKGRSETIVGNAELEKMILN